MKYQCEACYKMFIHPAKIIETAQDGAKDKIYRVLRQSESADEFPFHSEFESIRVTLNNLNSIVADGQFEITVCPFCQSRTYTEAPEPEAKVTNVYVHDLTSGPQGTLDNLLAEGYVIVSRFAKQYHLERKEKVKTE